MIPFKMVCKILFKMEEENNMGGDMINILDQEVEIDRSALRICLQIYQMVIGIVVGVIIGTLKIE